MKYQVEYNSDQVLVYLDGDCLPLLVFHVDTMEEAQAIAEKFINETNEG